MTNANYRKGRNLEYELIKKLEHANEFWPLEENAQPVRSAGSHTVLDVVNVLPGSTCQVYQCKNKRYPESDVNPEFIPAAFNEFISKCREMRLDGWCVFKNARGHIVMRRVKLLHENEDIQMKVKM
jgi:ribosomal protein S19